MSKPFQPVVLVSGSFMGFVLGLVSSPAWFLACAAFLVAYAVGLARWALK